MKKHNLLLVAHPDDETIFFGGLLQVHRRQLWKVICVTDGNADGGGKERQKDFLNACKKLRVHKAEMWDFPDRYESRLDMAPLIERLKAEKPNAIYTHGILGEYGHPHHQDVSLAAHRAFVGLPVWSVAYNCFAEKIFRIPRTAYNRKNELLAGIYHAETQRFARWLPSYNHEGYVRVSLKEVERLYDFLTGATLPKPDDLNVYAWFQPYLLEFRKQISARPF